MVLSIAAKTAHKKPCKRQVAQSTSATARHDIKMCRDLKNRNGRLLFASLWSIIVNRYEVYNFEFFFARGSGDLNFVAHFSI